MSASTKRLAHLRELLSQPLSKSTQQEIRDHLQDWPDGPSKQQAIDYASDHVEATFAPPPRDYFKTAEEQKMRFDEETQTLYTNKGELLKQFSCPLTKKWEELAPTGDDDFKRFCASCSKHVINTQGMTDGEVQVLLRHDPDVCLHVDSRYGNVAAMRPKEDAYTQHSSNRAWERRRTPGLRIIRTARTEHEINLAAQQGYRPLVKPARPSGKIGTPMQVLQHKQFGTIEIRGDIRGFVYGEDPDYTVIMQTSYDPGEHLPSPFAAYLIPPDLQPGERVYLEDLIEDLIDVTHQGNSRLAGAEAIWDGADFTIQYDEENDVMHAIG